jgi:hypothetical protein
VGLIDGGACHLTTWPSLSLQHPYPPRRAENKEKQEQQIALQGSSQVERVTEGDDLPDPTDLKKAESQPYQSGLAPVGALQHSYSAPEATTPRRGM